MTTLTLFLQIVLRLLTRFSLAVPKRLPDLVGVQFLFPSLIR
jgi:hypothetical protein